MNFDDDFNESLDANIDLTPIIDVLFLLLIFFIMTTTFSKPVIELILPEAGSAALQKKQEEMVILIGKDGDVFCDNVQVEATQEVLDSLLQEKSSLPITFLVHKDAPFEAFMLVLDRARMQGRSDFSITTLKENKSHGLETKSANEE